MGLFSLIAAQKVGPNGSIHAFEANPDVHTMFLANLRLNEVRTVRANLLALAEQPGELTFCINEDTSLSSLTDTGRGRVARRITVRATNLDEYTKTQSLPPVKFLKLDLEGFEWDALRGATGLIARNPEMAILCELAPRNLIPRKIRITDVLAWIHGQGLAVWEIDLAHRRLVQLTGNVPIYGHRNYFFARQSSHMAGLLDTLTANIPKGVKS
jgi:FkbM family methyltransferase